MNKIRKSSSKPLIGMRTLKTGMGVILTLVVAELGWIINPIYATIGTVLAMQPTMKGSFVLGKNRLLGTLIGGLIAFAFATVFNPNILVTGVAVIVSICVCNSLKLSEGISIALTVLLSILIGLNDGDPLAYSLIRVWDTSVGVLVGILVNYYIAQPEYDKIFQKKFAVFYETITQLPGDKSVNLEELKHIKKEMRELESCYHQFIDDFPFNKETDEVKKEVLNEIVETCHEVYFHLKSLYLINESELDPMLEERMKSYHLAELVKLESFFAKLSQKITLSERKKMEKKNT